MKKEGSIPPEFLLKILRWFCPGGLIEGIEGDLREQFETDAQKHGDKAASFLFAWHVLTFFRLGILMRNKYSFTLVQYDMVKSYFILAGRTLRRNRLYTLINITGLTFGLAIGIILFWIVRFEHSFDRFHANVDRLYQIITDDKFGGVSSHVPQGAIYALQKEFPEVEKAAVVYGWGPSVIRIGDENIKPGNTFFIHPEFLEMIDVTWMAGSVESSLSKPYQVVIDELTAKKLFHEDNPLGKVIRYDNQMDVMVSGVIKKMPVNSMFQMPMIMSYETLTKYMPNYAEQDHWGGGDSWFHGYVLTKPGADTKSIEDRLTKRVKEHEAETTYTGFHLTSVKEEHFDLMNDPFNYVVPQWMLHVLLSLAFFLIIIACINFINLSTAQATQRAREIGMRKVMGGARSSVIFQFLTETGVLVTFSVLASCLVATQLIPYADRFFSTQVNQSVVWDADMIIYILILIVVVTLLAGIYPAFILSGYKPISVFHVTSFPGRSTRLRKSMVVAQFLMAQMMIICMVIGAQQVRSFYNTDPGFNKDGIVTVNMIYKDSVLLQERFQQALTKYPEIKGMTYALTSPSGTRNWWWGNAKNPGLPEGEQNFRLQWVDDNYFKFYGVPLIAGRTFVETDSGSVALVNEEVVHQMGSTNAEDVLGQKFTYWGNNTVTIIGVVKNYYSQGLKSEIPPHLYINGNWNFQLAQIKIDPLQSVMAIEHIKNEWTQLHPDNYFEYEFLSDDLNTFYEDERKLSNFIILFAVLSLIIGCLGLFGVVSFVCSRRTKEVSVRKVLGASITNILYLLSREFILLVAIAFMIAIPLGWYVMNEFLQRYTSHIDINWSVFALAGAITLVMALFTVILRAFRVALMNPAENLKYD